MKVDAARLQASADRASEFLKSLANGHRLMILCQLLDGERSVGDLARLLGVRASIVSQHLALLRKDGLVTARRDGQTHWYAISSQPARRVLESLYDSFCECEPLESEPAAPETEIYATGK